MGRGAWRARIVGLAVVAVCATAAALAIHASGLFTRVEHDTVDLRFSLRGKQKPPSELLVVGIDNESVHALPAYPFSRVLHARVLERLHRAGARLIVYDIGFDSPRSPAEDRSLLEAARRAAPVVFATSIISASGATGVLGGDRALASIGDQAAAADLLPDSDGTLRHMLGAVNGLPTIAAAVVHRERGGGFGRERWRDAWIDFRGPPGTMAELSFARVLRGQFPASAVRGKTVVVGATAPALQDLHATAAGSPMAGPEVQAEAISTALAGLPLRSPAGAATVLLIVAFALLAPLAALRLETVGVVAIALLALAAWTLSAQLAFDAGTVLDYSDAVAALALGAGGTVVLGMWAERRERNRLRMLFAGGQSAVIERVLDAPAGSVLKPTAIIAGYRVDALIARGGMGIVYRATQLSLERQVALKLIATERADDFEFRERFKSESRLAALIEHANVIPVYEAGEDDGLLFIAMRLVDGVDLDHLVTIGGPFAPERAARITTQIAGALDAAHARGLVHRDVKPANVLLTFDEPEHAYLTDFGIAKQLGALTGITRAGEWVGTLDYLAPEQIRGDRVGVEADIYALTGLLYRCLTGSTPFPRNSQAATMWAHLSAVPPPVSRLREELRDADEVLARGLAKDPAQRFPSAGALAAAFARALGISSPEPPAPAREPARRAASSYGDEQQTMPSA
jgi:CHASE2 domain-containing sensor protein